MRKRYSSYRKISRENRIHITVYEYDLQKNDKKAQINIIGLCENASGRAVETKFNGLVRMLVVDCSDYEFII